MSDPGPIVRPTKRRRTRKAPPMVEGDDSALDTAMYVDQEGGQKILVPVRLDAQDSSAMNNADPTSLASGSGSPAVDNQVDMDTELEPHHSRPQKKDRWFYMKEFVARADGILRAMQAKEALPNHTGCAECAESPAKWRCEECVGGKVLCRKCMRKSHAANPFHRVECWTGTHFRKAALWEVGVCLILPHQGETSLCPNLVQQQQLLERHQCRRDCQDTEQSVQPIPMPRAYNENADQAADTARESARDAELMRCFDRLLAGNNADEIMEEDDDAEHVDTEADLQDIDAGASGFVNYNGNQNENVFRPVSESTPLMGPHPTVPNRDSLNNEYVRVVHTNGIHHISLVYCTCQGHENIITDLIYAGWVPTSFVRIRTIFTAALLDHFRYCNLEMRSSAYQFCQMLRRVTNSLNPAWVVNLYHELRRLSRLWRWVKKLRWAGYAQQAGQPITPKPGELGIFCPACPQVGVNIPDNWREDPNRWVYRRVLTVDGNFKADHVRQKSAADDIWLSDGLGMTTRRAEYKEFLRIAIERKTRARCENTFRAIEQAMLSSKACDITGIVAVACARHGCFAPNSIVDLFRGEQQKNVDWSFLESIRTTGVDRDQGVMLIYDIICQYFIYLMTRIGHLLPIGLDIDRAIGLFHVHAHKEECLYRFSPSFIPGTGVVAGEILESLWAGLNPITTSCRTATLAHRAEIIDDHAADSNHKTALGIGPVLCNRFQQAKEMAHKTSIYYDQLTATIPASFKNKWERDIKSAESRRLQNPAAMDIIGTQDINAVPGHTPDPVSRARNSPEWLNIALSIEERQIDIQDRVKRLRSDPREEARLEVERLRQNLTSDLILLYSMQPAVDQQGPLAATASVHSGEDLFDDLDDEDLPPDAAAVSPDTEAQQDAIILPERKPLHLPSSNLPSDHHLSQSELSLRVKQASRYLAAIREAVADKSFQYSHIFRSAPSNTVQTRSRGVVRRLSERISYFSKVYCRSRAAMIRLGATDQTMKTFQELKKADVKASTAILDPNIPGSSTLHLSWIWQTGSRNAGSTPEAMREFQRVHWVRARAQKNRWDEEFLLVKYEMQWTTRYFMHMAKQWKDKFHNLEVDPGPKAYAARQSSQWNYLAKEADVLFRSANREYTSLVM